MSMQDDKRIILVTGYYGSGKTEFSLQYATKISEFYDKVYIADLDVVNVYFRSREKGEWLKQYGIEILGNDLGNDVIQDVPYISANIYKPMQDENSHVLMDLAGTKNGMKVVSSLIKDHLKKDTFELFCVINPYRPETDDVDKMMNVISELEVYSGLKMTGLINNSNLVQYTQSEDIINGDKLLKEVSEKMGIPIKYVMVPKKCQNDIAGKVSGELIIMDEIIIREDYH